MCKQEIQIFKFVAFQYFEDCEINDQNIYQFEFINLTDTSILINNSIVLQPNGQSFDRWKEDIQENEKTATIYRIRFLKRGGGLAAAAAAAPQDRLGLLVIAKMPVKPRE